MPSAFHVGLCDSVKIHGAQAGGIHRSQAGRNVLGPQQCNGQVREVPADTAAAQEGFHRAVRPAGGAADIPQFPVHPVPHGVQQLPAGGSVEFCVCGGQEAVRLRVAAGPDVADAVSQPGFFRPGPACHRRGVLHHHLGRFGELHVVEPAAVVVRNLAHGNLPAAGRDGQAFLEGRVSGVPGGGYGHGHLGVGGGLEDQACGNGAFHDSPVGVGRKEAAACPGRGCGQGTGASS